MIHYIKTAKNQRQKENINNRKKLPKKEITSQQQQEKNQKKIKYIFKMLRGNSYQARMIH